MITTFSMSSYQFIFLVQNFAKMKKRKKKKISHKISISSEKKLPNFKTKKFEKNSPHLESDFSLVAFFKLIF